MKKEWIKVGLLFLITVGVVFWALNYLFLSGKTAQKSRAGGETMALTFNPSSATASAIIPDFTTTLTIKPSVNVTLRGYRVRITFDKAKIQVKNIDYKLGAVSAGLGDTNSTLSTVNQNGSVLLLGEVQTLIATFSLLYL